MRYFLPASTAITVFMLVLLVTFVLCRTDQ